MGLGNMIRKLSPEALALQKAIGSEGTAYPRAMKDQGADDEEFSRFDEAELADEPSVGFDDQGRPKDSDEYLRSLLDEPMDGPGSPEEAAMMARLDGPDPRIPPQGGDPLNQASLGSSPDLDAIMGKTNSLIDDAAAQMGMDGDEFLQMLFAIRKGSQ